MVSILQYEMRNTSVLKIKCVSDSYDDDLAAICFDFNKESNDIVPIIQCCIL